MGDVNGDGYLNLFDVVRIINVIVGNASFTPEQMILADIEQNSYLNILDVVELVNIIMGFSNRYISLSDQVDELKIGFTASSILINSEGVTIVTPRGGGSGGLRPPAVTAL